MAVTLRHIASESGVDISVFSRVLNNFDHHICKRPSTDQGLCVSAFLEPEHEMGRTSVQMLNTLLENDPADLPSRIIDFDYLDLGSAARCSKK